MIHQIDAERAFLHVNKTEAERLGFTREEMKGMKLEDLASESFSMDWSLFTMNIREPNPINFSSKVNILI